MEQTPRRTALMSMLAATALAALKLSAGLITGSLSLISAGLESTGDTVAAAITFFAVRISGRPADADHPYGHRRIENLSALAESTILIAGGIFVVIEALGRLASGHGLTQAHWYLFLVIGIAFIIDICRILISLRSSARHGSAALRANAYHYISDMLGSVAVLAGLLAVALGFHDGDAVASLIVAAIIFIAAFSLIYKNALVLMDTVSPRALAEAEAAIIGLGGAFELRRLRLRESSGQFFADAVVAVPPALAVVESHDLADAIEDAVHKVLPGSDVVIHTEPQRSGLDLRDSVLAIALSEPLVREAHDITIYRHGDVRSVSLHLKMERAIPLAVVHETSERIEEALGALPEVDEAFTHLEPLEEPLVALDKSGDHEALPEEGRITQLVLKHTASPPRELRLLRTDLGLVVFVSVAALDLDLSAAHELAGRLEEGIRAGAPHIADVVVHTEP